VAATTLQAAVSPLDRWSSCHLGSALPGRSVDTISHPFRAREHARVQASNTDPTPSRKTAAR
jgi:hypothetical protein